MKLIALACLIFVTTDAASQEIERSNPAGMTQPTAYSHLVQFDRLMFIAGQVAVDPDGKFVGEGDMSAQVRQVLENMQKVLATRGADFSDVVKVNIFTTDIEDFFTTSDVRQEFFAGHAPASTLVQIERLARPAFLVEIEAIAIAPD